MKLTPVSSPVAVQSAPAADKRQAAINAFKTGQSSFDKPAPTQGNAQDTAVANPNKISPEEMSAVKPASKIAAPAEEPQGEPVEGLETAPVEEVKPVETKTSQEWAKLARQERELRAKIQRQEAQYKQREAALVARESELQSKSEMNQKGFVDINKLKNDPIGTLQDLGVTYDELANQMMNPTKIDPRLQAHIDRLQAKIETLEKGTTETNERVSKQQQQAYDQAVKQIELDTRNLVNSDPNFETIKATGSTKDVVELITETFNKDGILMTVEDAANEVENYLIEEAMKLTKIEKIKRKLQPQTTVVKKQAEAGQQQQSQGTDSTPSMKTLTNAASSTRKLSARERALLAFRNELK